MYKGIIYLYKSPSNKCYVGQTINEMSRKSAFRSKTKSYGNAKIDNARKKYGPSKFKYTVLYTIISNTEKDLKIWLDCIEVQMIAKYDSIMNGYNIQTGGKSLSTNDKELISKRLKEYYKTHSNPFSGRKHSSESKLILSKLAIKRMENSEKKYGDNHDKSWKEYLRDKSSKAVLQLNKITGELIREYPSAAEAARCLGNPKMFSDISKACWYAIDNTKRRVVSAGGYKWRFKESSTTISKESSTK